MLVLLCSEFGLQVLLFLLFLVDEAIFGDYSLFLLYGFLAHAFDGVLHGADLPVKPNFEFADPLL